MKPSFYVRIKVIKLGDVEEVGEIVIEDINQDLEAERKGTVLRLESERKERKKLTLEMILIKLMLILSRRSLFGNRPLARMRSMKDSIGSQ